MRSTGLHWFRQRQRALTRLLLAAFCLAWLQVAAMPCVMAAGFAALQGTSEAGIDADLAAGMPAGMTMAEGEHCAYCPPDAAGGGVDVADVCSYPHDPQVDLRLGLAAVLLAPPPVTLLVVTADGAARIIGGCAACAAPPAPHAPLNLRFCRFLE